jgi:hypothetical protein
MSDFLDRKRKELEAKPKSPILRDEHNRPIDPQAGHKIANELLTKLVNEQRQAEIENSFRNVKGMKRDIVVHLAVTVLPRVDGHTVIGEQEREYGQWCFVLPAKALPIKNFTAIKAFSELCHLGKQALMKLGMVKP